jgi:hypothetical protein
MNAVKKLGAKINSERFSKAYATAVVVGYGLLLVANPAEAQSLRQTGETIFNTIYGLVGVLGGIAVLGAAINWKFGNLMGMQDPKKAFMSAIIGTGLAFGVVGIIQFVKGAVQTGGGISGV